MTIISITPIDSIALIGCFEHLLIFELSMSLVLALHYISKIWAMTSLKSPWTMNIRKS